MLAGSLILMVFTSPAMAAVVVAAGLLGALPARHWKNLRAAARTVRPVSLVVLMAKLIVLFSTSSCMGFTILSRLH